MDVKTGAEVTVTVIAPLPREKMWELVTAVDRIGEWSPETVGATWDGPRRFIGHNRFPDGFESTVTCVITESTEPRVFAWDVLDDDGRPGSHWRYELRDGAEPGTTEVRHSFVHGPGRTGVPADTGSVNDRLVTLCRTMTSTITAMTLDSTGATR
ncbi:SRPBCC family protein [Actinoplanes hulinensis]|uniref:SRPBCC family protein n=1 Tax=Actinoplanes hulinensis TaxID=1144547 RepID=A0ABS7BGX9_9ACTN|nr:SRPBCC family protein [Actinoplanes hulinensis]MBW6440062.1 SRPBCC family protein [Actinoplanes hulinensis]